MFEHIDTNFFNIAQSEIRMNISRQPTEKEMCFHRLKKIIHIKKENDKIKIKNGIKYKYGRNILENIEKYHCYQEIKFDETVEKFEEHNFSLITNPINYVSFNGSIPVKQFFL